MAQKKFPITLFVLQLNQWVWNNKARIIVSCKLFDKNFCFCSIELCLALQPLVFFLQQEKIRSTQKIQNKNNKLEKHYLTQKISFKLFNLFNIIQLRRIEICTAQFLMNCLWSNIDRSKLSTNSGHSRQQDPGTFRVPSI